MANIFISHSTIDGKLANYLCESFESRGLSCWIAPRNITPGEEWATSITNAILSADIFFIVYSKNSLKSAQCAREIAIADRKNKYILPYKIDDSEPEGAFDYYLTGCQWVIVDPATGEYKIDELCELMRSYISKNSSDSQTQAAEAIRALDDMIRKDVQPSQTVVMPQQPVSSSQPAVAPQKHVAPSKPVVLPRQPVESKQPVVKTQHPAPGKRTASQPRRVVQTDAKQTKKGKITKAQKERRNFMMMAIGLLLLICVVIALLIGAVVSRNKDASANSGGGIFQGISTTPAKYFTYEETDNGIIITGYTGEDSSVKIPSEIKGTPVTGLAEKAFFQCETIYSVELPDTIQEIPAYAFYKCTNLSEIVFEDGVISIGTHAFEGCTSLTEVDFPESVITVGDFAFNSCTGLTTIDMPGVQTIGIYAFATCQSLNHVTLPDSLESIGEMAFAYCTGMGEIAIPDRTENVSLSAFSGCSNLSVIYRGETYTNDISALFGE